MYFLPIGSIAGGNFSFIIQKVWTDAIDHVRAYIRIREAGYSGGFSGGF